MKTVRFSPVDKLNLFQTSMKLDPEKVNCQAKSVIAAVLTTLNDAGISLAPAQRIQRNLGLSNHLWAAAAKGVDASGFLQRIQRKDARAGRQYFWLVVLPGEEIASATQAALVSMRTLPLPSNLTYRARHLAALYTLEKIVLGDSSVEVPDVETPEDEALDAEILGGETLLGETLPPRVLPHEGLSLLSSSSSSHNSFQSKEAAATRTHEGERAHEPREAAAAAPKGQDFDLDQPKAAAAASREPAQTSTAATQRVAASVEGDGLASWLVGELKARKAELVRTDAPATPAQVKVCVAAVVALAAGDEVEARQYLEDRLTYYKLRGEGRPKSLSTLLGFLADRGDFEKWASLPPAPAPKKVKNQFARDPDDVPRPPVKSNPEDARAIAALFGVVLPAVPVARNGEGVNHEN